MYLRTVASSPCRCSKAARVRRAAASTRPPLSAHRQPQRGVLGFLLLLIPLRVFHLLPSLSLLPWIVPDAGTIAPASLLGSWTAGTATH